jgi:hypothetical protein
MVIMRYPGVGRRVLVILEMLCHMEFEEHDSALSNGSKTWNVFYFITSPKKYCSAFIAVSGVLYGGTGAKLQANEVNEFFSSYLILPAALGHGIYSACNINEYQKQKNNVSGE